MWRGGRIDWQELIDSDSDESDGYESRLRREASPSSIEPASQRSSPPGSPFNGFSGGLVPVGPDVLDGKPRLSLFPPRRLGWVTVRPLASLSSIPSSMQWGESCTHRQVKGGGEEKICTGCSTSRR